MQLFSYIAPLLLSSAVVAKPLHIEINIDDNQAPVQINKKSLDPRSFILRVEPSYDIRGGIVSIPNWDHPVLSLSGSGDAPPLIFQLEGNQLHAVRRIIQILPSGEMSLQGYEPKGLPVKFYIGEDQESGEKNILQYSLPFNEAKSTDFVFDDSRLLVCLPNVICRKNERPLKLNVVPIEEFASVSTAIKKIETTSLGKKKSNKQLTIASSGSDGPELTELSDPFTIQITDKEGNTLKGPSGQAFFLGRSILRIYPARLALRDNSPPDRFELHDGALSTFGSQLSVFTDGLLAVAPEAPVFLTWLAVKHKGKTILAINDGRMSYTEFKVPALENMRDVYAYIPNRIGRSDLEQTILLQIAQPSYYVGAASEEL